MTETRLRAPEILRVRVHGVKLYNDGETLDVELTKPISAFVGANGIGKSTLLALINFGMTGLVPDANSSFQSVEEYVGKKSSFATSYFSGRVDEFARQTASVCVTFRLGTQTFEVERGLFEGRLVRSFSVTNAESGDRRSESDDLSSSSDLALAFQTAVVEAAGLANFEQFGFWQLFLMTFDERRHLLFWDEKTIQSALMIALGRSPQDAVEAEGLTRNIERQDSLARNARWRATQATNKRRKLAQKSSNGAGFTDEEMLALREQHELLQAREANCRRGLDEAETSLRDTARSVAELAIAESELEQTYLRRFSRPEERRNPIDSSLLQTILVGGKCGLCGAETHNLGHNVREALESHICPICDSAVDLTEGANSDHAELVELDSRLAETTKNVQEARAKYLRIREEVESLSREWKVSSQELNDFLSTNTGVLDTERAQDQIAAIERYDHEIAEAMRDAEKYRQVRDDFRSRLEPIIVGLVEAYALIEKQFVPNFRRLAEQFIGRSVDVEFERRGAHIGLRFALEGQSRRNASELSESQQFFLDIALRMSIIQTFVRDRSTLLIDTPEGSLDIAYETRAGMLFDQFAKTGHSLVMMSNLNSSNLLGQLTMSSSTDEMEIFKMVDWSRLSEVQIESSTLFDEVYLDLEERLQSSGEPG